MDDCRDQFQIEIQPICTCGRSLCCIWKSGRGDCRRSYLEIEPCSSCKGRSYNDGHLEGFLKGYEECEKQQRKIENVNR